MGFAVAGAGHLGLGGFEEAAVGRVEARLDDLADRLAGVAEALEADRRRRLPLGPRADPHPGVGDHAEDPLAAEQHPVRGRPGARPRQPPALPGPPRGHRAHRLDQVVDVRFLGREVAAGAGRDPAAERRVLERLRVAAHRQPVLPQLLLEPRPGRPGLDPRRQAGRVDFDQAVDAAQVERHRGPVAEPRLDPADDAGAAAEGDHRGALGLGPVQHRLHLRAVARARHQVGRVLEAPVEAADDVAVGLAHRPRHALVLVVGEEVAERLRALQPRPADLDLVERHGGLRLTAEAEPRPDPRRRLGHLRRRRRLVLVAPAPMLEAPLGHATPGATTSGRLSSRWANATASVDGAFSGRSSPSLPFAACESGKSL